MLFLMVYLQQHYLSGNKIIGVFIPQKFLLVNENEGRWLFIFSIVENMAY